MSIERPKQDFITQENLKSKKDHVIHIQELSCTSILSQAYYELVYTGYNLLGDYMVNNAYLLDIWCANP